MRNATLQPAHAANCRSTRTVTLCIVDPKQNDYRQWAAAQADGIHVEIVATAAEALRIARNQVIDLWVVNTQLPGLSGCELCTMLKARSTSAVVCLVADEYSPETELSAWNSRATWFSCKPVHLAGIEQWFDERRTQVSGRTASSAVSN